MRIWERLKQIALLLTALLPIAHATAQQMGGYPMSGAPAFMAGQGYSSPAYQGVPQSFPSSPGISQFDHALEQTFQTDGLWFRRFLSGMSPRNEYSFNVDYIRTRSRGQKGLIGNPNAVTAVQDGAAANGSITLGAPEADLLGAFPVRSAADAAEILQSGIRLSGAVENRQGWGFSWWAAYAGDASSRRHLDDERLASQLHFSDALYLSQSSGVPASSNGLRIYDERDIVENIILGRRTFDAADAQTFGISGDTSEVLDRHIYPYAAVPILRGPGLIPADITASQEPYGTPLVYDVYFDIETQLETYGTGAQFSLSPVYEDDTFKVRPLVGGRFFRIDESFLWRGGHAGLGYSVNIPDGVDDDGDFWIDNVDENGTTNFVSILTNTTGTQQILVRSFAHVAVQSQMGGPEFGFDYRVGEKKGIEFTGHTKVGLMVNTEKYRLSGDNIGAQFILGPTDATTGDTTRADLGDTTTSIVGGPRPNAFSSQTSTTHLSPMFEQQLNAELPIFAQIPVLRDIWQLEHAKLRLGWNFLYMGEVADPSASIDYTSRPTDGIFPGLQVRRRGFWQNTLNAGINWEF